MPNDRQPESEVHPHRTAMNSESNPNSIPSLLRDLRDETTTLLRQEVALAKTELKENVSRMGSHAAQIAVGGFVAFVTSMLLVISPLKHLIDVNQPLQRGMTAAELIFGLIDEPLEPAGGTRRLEHARGEIEFRDVTFSYGAPDRPTLDRVSFTAAPRSAPACRRSRTPAPASDALPPARPVRLQI